MEELDRGWAGRRHPPERRGTLARHQHPPDQLPTGHRHPPQQRTTLLGGLVFVAVLAAAGCGGSAGDGGELPGTESAATSAPTASDGAAGTTEPATTAPTTTPAVSTGATPTTSIATSTTTPAATAVPATTATDPPTTATDPPTTATTAPRPEASTLDELLELGRPLVIAHAGGDQDYPHSTVYAFAQSAAAGADVLELDVQLTADGALIVQHDDTVDRTTPDTGPVAALTLDEIQALDNAHWFVPGRWGDQTRPDEEYVFRGVRQGGVEPPAGFKAEDFRVPTFREVAARFPHHVLDVEIKLQRGPDGEEDPRAGIAAAEVLAAEIAELGREQSVIVASFNDEVLAAFSRLAPAVVTSPGEATMLGWFAAGEPLASQYSVLQVPFTYQGIEVVQPEVVERLHREGRQVWVWLSGTDVVETREFYASLLALGVDGLIAGRPAEAVAALADAAR